jgi:hypothetical protein
MATTTPILDDDELQRRAMAIPGYEGLILRKNFPELEKTHMRDMSVEIPLLASIGSSLR